MVNKIIVYKSSVTSGGIPESLCDSCLEKRKKAVQENGGCVFNEGKADGETCDVCFKS